MEPMSGNADTKRKSGDLPTFDTCEVRFRKAKNTNTLLFSVPAQSSALLPLLNPKCHAYEERDRRWLHLLQAIALVPSRNVDTIVESARQGMKLTVSPVFKQRLEKTLMPLLDELESVDEFDFAERSMIGLKLKEKVAAVLREWIADPIEGFVLRKEHVVAGLHMDDLIATPVGAGYLRGFRPDDGFCIVLFPWGHGFIHLKSVDQLELAIEKERKKRKFNQFTVLEHQQLYEDIEHILENYPPDENGVEFSGVTPDGVNIEDYGKLLATLKEEHFDAEILQRDWSFVRRVQALATKIKNQHTESAQSRHGIEDHEGDRQAEVAVGMDADHEDASKSVQAPVAGET